MISFEGLCFAERAERPGIDLVVEGCLEVKIGNFFVPEVSAAKGRILGAEIDPASNHVIYRTSPIGVYIASLEHDAKDTGAPLTPDVVTVVDLKTLFLVKYDAGG